MKRLFLAALLSVLIVVDWFVVEYYKPVRKLPLRMK